MQTYLSKFLKLENNEIKPRYDWQAAHDLPKPTLTWHLYQSLSQNLGYKPTALECAQLLYSAQKSAREVENEFKRIDE